MFIDTIQLDIYDSIKEAQSIFVTSYLYHMAPLVPLEHQSLYEMHLVDAYEHNRHWPRGCYTIALLLRTSQHKSS